MTSKYFYIALSLLLFSLPGTAQQYTDLTLEQSLSRMRKENRTLKIAGKEVELAKNDRQKLNALWYPNVSASGAYVHLSNKIEVKEPLNQFTDPVKDFVHSIIPDDQIISSILDKIGSYSLTFPLMPKNLTTIDANLIWPVFTGGKRIYAGKIGRSLESIAEVNRDRTDATVQSAVITAYYGLRLSAKVVKVREETYDVFAQHYRNALKLEQNGQINKAERLASQVIMDESKRELESARKELNVAQNALKSLLSFGQEEVINPVSPLFINDSIPPLLYFRSLIEGNNYIVNGLRLQENIASTELKIGRTGYIPNVALFAKHTFYADGIPKNLVPRSFIGVGFTWNIFDGLDREKNIKRAKIARQSLELGREKAVSELGVAVDKLYSELQDACDNVKALDATISLSRELVRMRKKLFQEGMATSTEVTDAETMLSKVQIAYLMAYYQYDVTLANLLATCGIPETFGQYIHEGKTEDFIFAP